MGMGAEVSEQTQMASAAPVLRSLSVIANEVWADWSPAGISAQPYLVAMSQMDSIEEDFYSDSGKSVVAYFLANAGQWRGPVARRVKAELREMVK